MKHLFILAAAIFVMATNASAQNVPTYNNAERSLAPNATSRADDSVLANVRILPNPSSGMIILMVDDANPDVLAQGEAVVYNSGGQPVAKKAYTTGVNDIFVNNLASGIYFLQLMPKSGLAVVKEFAVAR